jgi:hypothetical protein
MQKAIKMSKQTEYWGWRSMTELEKQLRKTITLAEKKGLTLAVEFMKGFIEKEKVINAKQRKHTQVSQ